MVEQCEADAWLRELAVCWTIFEKASEGILYYPVSGDRVAMVNEACARMHGYSRDAMRNMKLQDLDAADLSLVSPPETPKVVGRGASDL